MIVTATEFKNKVGKYIKIAENENIIISKNGKLIAKLVSIENDEYPLTDDLLGAFSMVSEVDLSEAKNERLSKYDNPD